MYAAHEILKLDSLRVIHAGEHAFPLAEGILAVPVTRILEDRAPLD